MICKNYLTYIQLNSVQSILNLIFCKYTLFWIWYLQHIPKKVGIITFCFYLRFTQHPNSFGIVVLLQIKLIIFISFFSSLPQLQQICKILNTHMDSLQWIDQNSVLLQRRVEEVSKLCDNQRKEQEKTFRLTFDWSGINMLTCILTQC